VTKIKKNS